MELQYLRSHGTAKPLQVGKRIADGQLGHVVKLGSFVHLGSLVQFDALGTVIAIGHLVIVEKFVPVEQLGAIWNISAVALLGQLVPPCHYVLSLWRGETLAINLQWLSYRTTEVGQ